MIPTTLTETTAKALTVLASLRGERSYVALKARLGWGIPTQAVILGKLEEAGLVRTVKHRDACRSYVITKAGAKAIEEYDRVALTPLVHVLEPATLGPVKPWLPE